jgi:hypothetical protein
MTEAEWLTCEEPDHMLSRLESMEYSRARVPVYIATFGASGRVRRLLPPELQAAFDDYVRWVQEGGPNPTTLYPQWTAFDPFEKRVGRRVIDPLDLADNLRGMIRFPPSWYTASSFVLAEACGRVGVRQSFWKPTPATAGLLQNAIERLRDVVGNPFCPVAFAPEWRTDTALSLAKQMYKSRDFSAMPILADALQDAGCDSDDILSHCRGEGAHVRGCWVVDLVLGKE